MNKEQAASTPFIGWKACEQAFYLDGMPISDEQAAEHWHKGTAKFLPNAVKQIEKYIAFDQDDSDCSPAGPVA